LSVLGLALFSGVAYLQEIATSQRSEFYAGIALSMSKNLSNWWWGASDPGGTITLDKIPGSYWIPAIFVKVFGFSTWSVNAPSAIACTVAVIVIAATGHRLAGPTGGLIAGAVAATTPVFAAVARANQPEGFFLLWIAVAAYFGVRATQDASFKHLMLGGVAIALAFHSYMLVAWAAWPALGLAWLTVSVPVWRRIWQLLVAGLTSLVLSFVWILSVALTPASQRPFIGGSDTNSAFEMVFGYNGLGRFGAAASGGASSDGSATSIRGFTPPFSGTAGVLRLVNAQLLPQIGWLIPATLAAVVCILASRRVRSESWFVIGFFGVYAVLFSAVAGMHQFYTAELGLGAGLVLAQAIGLARQRGNRAVPVVIVSLAALKALFIAVQYENYLLWAPVVQLLLALVAVVLLLLNPLPARAVLLPVLVTVGLVFTPAAWAYDSHSFSSSINPVAGPTSGMGHLGGPGLGGRGTGGGPGGASPFSNQTDSGLIKYLKAHRGGSRYLVAMFGTMAAAPYITATGENILPIGGFDGEDPSPTLAQIKAMVAFGELKYFEVTSNSFAGGAPGANGSATTTIGQANGAKIRSWVLAKCQLSGYSGGNLYLCKASSAG
ncbi:MAG: ArnT family glycosyltransferase, partial [Micrococcales bacterium]